MKRVVGKEREVPGSIFQESSPVNPLRSSSISIPTQTLDHCHCNLLSLQDNNQQLSPRHHRNHFNTKISSLI
ncbi:hypothetical protein MIMGU_mgv1a022449mg [Erythranthe guttata]|uniref:Uncharacterized protein n=1 Tax=Erythranthe guttata TaxID=4155 RepID=A0A022QKZ8_ERYGU|nr:hypothetical protein MIMGU_mgv1a022449mg [Erythranthe guttata]